MANNVGYTEGSGKDIATDDVAGVHYQVVKLASGTEDSSARIGGDAANGLDVDVTRVSGTVTVDGSGVTQPVSHAALTELAAAIDTEVQVDIVGALPAGTNAIGKLAANSGVDIGDVDVTSVIPGTGATNLGKAIDGIAGATDTGVAPLAVRDDALGALTPAEGDYVPLRTDSTGALWVATDDTIAVSNAGLTELAAAINASSQMDVNIAASNATVAVSNAGITTIAGAVSGTEMQVDVLTIAAGDNNIGNVDIASIAAGDNNIGNVDVVTLPGTAAEAAALPSVFVVVAADDGTDTQPLQLNAAGDLKVTLDSETVALAAGTNNIGDVDILSIAAGDNNIGNVDIVTMPNVTLAAGTNTNEVVGDIAHDTGVGGNPVQIAGEAKDMDDTAVPNQVSAESDTTRLATDRDGALFVRPFGPRIWSYHLDTSSAQTDTTVHAAPAAGLSLYVTDIVFSSGAATAINLFFEEGASKVLGPYYLEAVAGRGMALHFQTPKKITAATALTLTTSAAIAHSVDVTGFTAAG